MGIKARVYDGEVRKFVSGIGVENVGKRLVNSNEEPPKLDQPKMTIQKLLEYGNMLVEEQENVNRVPLSDKYLKEAALGNANDDTINRGTFYAGAIAYMATTSTFFEFNAFWYFLLSHQCVLLY